ncbi:MAG: bifunctional diaminohydroxyphosphoribosylaminopyrimidine deaminase/5-amino-6-(5-phosphoribosylamino)uracil reductase RibD [Lachnospiraceae bacterium]|nr:bifunctional diaminohydroxyphosphoribosylaminopyrimidine deaminase/5-amino-6-(5-phosphoribosylamino)uracil reductase RibD [Lachnospiraceae bacterium]
MKQEEYYMRQALDLAAKGMGHTSPNPMVGCVVVKNGHVIAEGYHEKCGSFHAERNALLHCKEDPAGAELYVTLEPCCHYGKTPPCTEIILEKGIKKVYVGAMDPNPLVAGKRVSILREQGVEVVTGIIEEECLKLNEVFFHYITTGLPYIVMKYAMTLDGKIAVASGDSKWVTGEQARNHVQQLRKRYSGILVGIDTVLADNPMLNVRIEENVNPVRIILDSSLKTPLESKIVKTAREIPTICVGRQEEIDKAGRQSKIDILKKSGINVIVQPGSGQIDLFSLLKELGEQKIDSILIEGGGKVHGSFLSQGLVDKACIYIAPKLAGKSSYSPINSFPLEKMSRAYSLKFDEMKKIGEDLYLTAYPKKNIKCGCI